MKKVIIGTLLALSLAARPEQPLAQPSAQWPGELPTNRARDSALMFRVSGTPHIVIRTISASALICLRAA